jgi:16S rRNA (cytidine1402-2'-O)-methyltransferase
MTRPAGTLYLVPNTLDLGAGVDAPSLEDVLAPCVIRIASRLQHWVVEDAKTARRFLKRVDAAAALTRPLQALSIVELPRHTKGPIHRPPADQQVLLAPALQGHDIGLLSEAGLPAVADPGSTLVRLAHSRNIGVVALPGPSSLMLALAASGMNGQSFSFVGYLPIESRARATRIRELELQSRQDGQTQLMIETPYRNQALLDALLACLDESTTLSVSCGLTLGTGFTRTDSVSAWRSRAMKLPADIPAVFLLLARAPT